MTPHQGSRRTCSDRVDAPLRSGPHRQLHALARERRRLDRELVSAENLLRTLTAKRQQAPDGPASALAGFALRRVVEKREARRQLRRQMEELGGRVPAEA